MNKFAKKISEFTLLFCPFLTICHQAYGIGLSQDIVSETEDGHPEYAVTELHDQADVCGGYWDFTDFALKVQKFMGASGVDAAKAARVLLTGKLFVQVNNERYAEYLKEGGHLDWESWVFLTTLEREQKARGM